MSFGVPAGWPGEHRGSIYFHFPGGKQELAREAIARAADEIEEMVHRAASQADDPALLIRALAHIQVQRLEASGYCSGCAIATMVLESAPQDEELSAEFDKVFARWRTALVGHLEPWGLEPQRGPVPACRESIDDSRHDHQRRPGPGLRRPVIVVRRCKPGVPGNRAETVSPAVPGVTGPSPIAPEPSATSSPATFLTGAPWPRWPGPLSGGCRRPWSAR